MLFKFCKKHYRIEIFFRLSRSKVLYKFGSGLNPTFDDQTGWFKKIIIENSSKHISYSD